MIRDAILKTKRDELTKCITSRKRKLSELYYATVSFARAEPQKHQRDSESINNNVESAFLEANDLLKGRFFNPDTLPLQSDVKVGNHKDFLRSHSITTSYKTSGKHGNANIACDGGSVSNANASEATTKQDKSIVTNGNVEPVSVSPEIVDGIHDTSRRSSRGAQTDLPIVPSRASKNDDHQGPKATYSLHGIRDQTNTVDGDISSFLNNEVVDGVAPSEALPLSLDDVDSLSHSELISASVKTRPGHARTVHLPPKETQERHLQYLSHNTNGEPKDSREALYESDGITNDGGSRKQSTGQSKIGTNVISELEPHSQSDRMDLDLHASEPDNVKDGSTADVNTNSHVSSTQVQDSLLNSQLETARKSTLETAPSTPDAQLRLEEAQFLKPSTKRRESETLQSKNESLQELGKASGLSSQYLGDRMQLDKPSGENKVTMQYGVHNRDENDGSLSRYMTNLQSHKHPGMTRDLSKDLMFSPRPPMRIDTSAVPVHNSNEVVKSRSADRTPSQAPLSHHSTSRSSTPVKAVPHTPVPERMTTRVSSGALKHKSVSEILGETPRIAHSGDRTPADISGHDSFRDIVDLQTPKSADLIASPDSIGFRSRLSELRERERERTKLSTVVFARQQPSSSSRNPESSSEQGMAMRSSHAENKDYLVLLFAAQVSSPPRSQPLNSLLASSHKTLSTSNHYLDFHEGQDCRILKRIYSLQNTNRWSLRQFERSTEPKRPASHWDALMGHVKWMRTDFREERKWKLATAKNLADWCAEWVSSSPGTRICLQVKTKSRSFGSNAGSEPTPDLIPSAEDDSSDAMDEGTPPADFTKASVPAAIFSLAPEDVLFGLDKTPISEKLLSELPLYQPWNDPNSASPFSKMTSSDNAWKRPVVPISKFAIGKMVIREQGPVRKKSRYHYADEDEPDRVHAGRPFLTSDYVSDTLGAEQDDVALFNPENKHIRDRIHAGHAFRPPSEYNMPSQSFFESRQSSQWTWSEDDELRRLVREYAYNWSLIASCLSSPSVFSSGAERRTPWECFERWVSLEGLPADMSKTQYFRAYHSRLEAAQRTLMAQQQAAQQQQGANAQMPIRRRTALPVRVDRRKNNKHLALVHAMQKLAKKRETALQKQQHFASLAAMRKANEAAQPKAQMQTPQEFSRFKYERECKMQERAEAYRQQILAQQRVTSSDTALQLAEVNNEKAALQQKASLQNGQQPNAPQPGRVPPSSMSNGTSPSLASSIPVGQLPAGHPAQTRHVPPSQPMMNGAQMNGVLPNGQMGVRGGGVPQAPMQPHMPGQQRMPSQPGPENMRILMEANRLQQEQQRYLQQQRQQQHQPNGHSLNSSSPSHGSINAMAPNNPAMLANLQSTNGITSPPINGALAPPRPSASPRTTNATAMQPQTLSSGMVPAVANITSQIKALHPQASPEQINKMATDSLNQYRMRHQAQAITAAVGNPANMPGVPHISGGLHVPSPQQVLNGVGGAAGLNPQVYAQMMRSQQSSQQDRIGGNGMNGGRPPSRGATPQIHGTGNTGQTGPSQTPRPPQAQMAGMP